MPKAARETKTPHGNRRSEDKQPITSQNSPAPTLGTPSDADGVDPIGAGAVRLCVYAGIRGWTMMAIAGHQALGVGIGLVSIGTDLVGGFCNLLGTGSRQQDDSGGPTIEALEAEMRSRATRAPDKKPAFNAKKSKLDKQDIKQTPTAAPLAQFTSLSPPKQVSSELPTQAVLTPRRHQMGTKLKLELALLKNRRSIYSFNAFKAKTQYTGPRQMPNYRPAALPGLYHTPVAVSKYGTSELDLFRYSLRATILTEDEVFSLYLTSTKNVLPRFAINTTALARAKELLMDEEFAKVLPHVHGFVGYWVAEFEQINKEIALMALAQYYKDTTVKEQELPNLYELRKSQAIQSSITPSKHDIFRLRTIVADPALKRADPTSHGM